MVKILSFDFFPKYLVIGEKLGKTVIVLEGRPISTYPFEFFLLTSGPIYGQNISSKATYKLVTLPRKFHSIAVQK